MQIANLQVTPSAPERKQWFRNLLVFFAPVGIIYLVALTGILQLEGHAFSLTDFIPSEFTFGAIVLYILNSILDYLRKVRAS